MRVITLFAVLCGLVSADDKWLEFRSGPIEVLTNTGEKQGRETLNELEQLRHTLGTSLGKQELISVWPIRVMLVKPSKQQAVYPAFTLGRAAYIAQVANIDDETRAGVASILIRDNAGTLPVSIERGLISVFSTLQVVGTKVTLGAPPQTKDRDWSRVHMLSVDPQYSGKIRVLVSNLQRGIEPDVAYKNAFERTAEQIEAQLNDYISAGNYGTTPLSGKPLNPQRQLVPKTMESNGAALAQADLLLAHKRPEAKRAYEALVSANPAEANEGLGLLALAEGQQAAAKTHFESAVKSEKPGARALLELGRINSDKALLNKASQANPRWAEPSWILAGMEPIAARKIPLLKTATELDPRNTRYWLALADAQETNKQFADAAKSWGYAERATDDLAERERIRQVRAANENRRVEAEITARREAKEKAERELQDLKNKAIAEIRAFEAKANAGQKPLDPNVKLEEYKEEEILKFEGTLQRVECLGKQARLWVQSPSKLVNKFLVKDPTKIVISGGGERSLGCGVQRAGRRVIIEHDSSAQVIGITFP